jgi:hypothetical protein
MTTPKRLVVYVFLILCNVLVAVSFPTSSGPRVFLNESEILLEWQSVVVDADRDISIELAAVEGGETIFLHYMRQLVDSDEARNFYHLCDRRDGWTRCASALYLLQHPIDYCFTDFLIEWTVILMKVSSERPSLSQGHWSRRRWELR